tara:strand:- start:326 stop:1780 length:1455 start_codon:yes stop_codon:yes gene_type:complete
MGKGGSSTSVEIPDYIENAARNNLQRADFVSKLGYVPQSFGPTVAAFTPMQQSAFGNTAQAADAFGLGTPTGADIYGGMGAPTQFANGVSAYSAYPLFEQSLADFANKRPGQFNAINSMFIDPYGYNPAGFFDMGELVDVNTGLPTNITTTTPVTTGGNGGSGGGGSNFTTTNIFQPTDQVIATVPDDQLTGNFGQDNQLFNPDINYDDPFVASNNQIVGVLDPRQEALDVMQSEYGIDPSFYTDSPIYSASDFPVGSSVSGYDFSQYDTSDKPNSNNLFQNQYGSTVSTGYGVGQVDPTLAAAAGYTNRPYNVAEDLNRSLFDQTYNPDGNFFSRALTNTFTDPALGNVVTPVAPSQSSQESSETQLTGIINQFGGQELIDAGSTLPRQNMLPSLQSQFGTLTTAETAQQASLDQQSIPLGKGGKKETRKVLDKAAQQGNLGSYVDSFMGKYGGNLNQFQQDTGISSATLKDIQKIAAAKVTA